MVVAVIPARGGSKRLRRKNVLPFAGRPLLSYSIDLARACRSIDRCIVSTEDEEIATLARRLGAQVLERPRDLATDMATTASVVINVVRTLQDQGHHPEVVVTLQPNCPCRAPGLIDRGLRMFRASDADSVVAVTASKHKIGRIRQGYFEPGYEPGIRSQDMAPTYFENGLLYVTRVSTLLNTGSLFGTRALPLETDQLSSVSDIDTALDFMLAEFVFERFRKHFLHDAPGGTPSAAPGHPAAGSAVVPS